MLMRKARLKTVAYAGLLISTLIGMAAAIGGAWIDRVETIRAAQRVEDLKCLAENVYYESRGELAVGQYAVAEVTMNRVASDEFPDSVCAVVHMRGAFSWTYRTDLNPPYGYEWRRATSIAESIYDNRESPLVNGALFYHALYVSPNWAATRRQVAVIGQHIFYL
jgi:spore germination cell wall hydrolase CwlJ-like protein